MAPRLPRFGLTGAVLVIEIVMIQIDPGPATPGPETGNVPFEELPIRFSLKIAVFDVPSVIRARVTVGP